MKQHRFNITATYGNVVDKYKGKDRCTVDDILWWLMKKSDLKKVVVEVAR